MLIELFFLLAQAVQFIRPPALGRLAPFKFLLLGRDFLAGEVEVHSHQGNLALRDGNAILEPGLGVGELFQLAPCPRELFL